LYLLSIGKPRFIFTHKPLDMKKILLLLLAAIITLTSVGQGTVKKGKASTGPYPRGWVLVEKGGKYGFISAEGDEIIKTQYTRISPFDEYLSGWALVEKDGFLGFISNSGDEVVKPQYTKIYPFDEMQRG